METPVSGAGAAGGSSNNDGNMSTDEDGRGTPTPPSTAERHSSGAGAAGAVSPAADSQGAMLPPSSPICREQLTKRIESLSQQVRTTAKFTITSTKH